MQNAEHTKTCLCLTGGEKHHSVTKQKNQLSHAVGVVISLSLKSRPAASIPQTTFFLCNEMLRNSSSATTAEASVRPNTVLLIDVKYSNQPLAAETLLDVLFASSGQRSVWSYCPDTATIAELYTIHFIGHSEFMVIRCLFWDVAMVSNMHFNFPGIPKWMSNFWPSQYNEIDASQCSWRVNGCYLIIIVCALLYFPDMFEKSLWVFPHEPDMGRLNLNNTSAATFVMS